MAIARVVIRYGGRVMQESTTDLKEDWTSGHQAAVRVASDRGSRRIRGWEGESCGLLVAAVC